MKIPTYPKPLRNIFLVCLLVLGISSCKVQLVSDYDQVIDHGLRDYKQLLNTFIKNASDAGGTEQGTFDSSKGTYNQLESKIDLLIDRARMQSTGSCKLVTNISSKIERIMGDQMPVVIAPNNQTENGNSYGCTERLLVLIKKQLLFVKEIHQTADKCRSRNGEQLSCIRITTSKTALDISNQSINAAWIVETTKRSSKRKTD
ncbi:hypothetical protein RQM59_06385 [Flavobacteriaceae bacterium S356]|uniref:Uncharacterized protein n=1 Tax=Asprobacillus argus TaxID=3076534 RepID=A0ABU3LFN4_9FLAO|nr:hypothetical protein [Flavobacteriaceae bacterium S356]